MSFILNLGTSLSMIIKTYSLDWTPLAPKMSEGNKNDSIHTKSILYIYILWCVKENEKCPRIQGVIWFLPDVFEGWVKIFNEREGLDPLWRTIPKVPILEDWLWIFSMLNFGLHEYKSKHLGGVGRRDIYTSCKSTTNGSTSNGKWRPFLFTFLRMCREIYMCIMNVHQSPCDFIMF